MSASWLAVAVLITGWFMTTESQGILSACSTSKGWAEEFRRRTKPHWCKPMDGGKHRTSNTRSRSHCVIVNHNMLRRNICHIHFHGRGSLVLVQARLQKCTESLSWTAHQSESNLHMFWYCMWVDGALAFRIVLTGSKHALDSRSWSPVATPISEGNKGQPPSRDSQSINQSIFISTSPNFNILW